MMKKLFEELKDLFEKRLLKNCQHWVTQEGL